MVMPHGDTAFRKLVNLCPVKRFPIILTPVCWSLDCQTLSSLFVHYHHSHKDRFFNKRKRVTGFFVFMTMLSFKQVESNYGKKDPCEQSCSWIIKFSHCLNFGYSKHGIIIFLI